MRWLRTLLWTLLWTVVAVCLAITIIPHFLDRIYYHGGPVAQFDGERFFNPDGDDDRIAVTRGTSRFGFISRQIFGDPTRPEWPERVDVAQAKPTARVNGGAMRVTWVGHASVLIQADGVNILTDPVWSQRAGPFGLGPSRVAAPGIAFEDLPPIDLVVVSHNHYDHIDLATLRRLWARDRPLVVTSLGNDAIISDAGVPARALDWGGSRELRPGVRVHVTRNHHWGSRWFSDRNRALWSSFVVTLPHGNVFFAGDTGLGDGKWPGEAAKLGAIRFAAIPIGAFRFSAGQMESGSHIGPRGALEVWNGLGRPYALPIHWGTFRLSWEGYYTPPRMLADMMMCGGANTAWFAPKPIGVSFDVPPLGNPTAPADLAAVSACERAGRFDALR